LGTEHFTYAQKTTEGFFTLGKVTAGTERIICYRSRFLGYVPTRWQKKASGTEASLHVNTDTRDDSYGAFRDVLTYRKVLAVLAIGRGL
jgi:hypothetical protein